MLKTPPKIRAAVDKYYKTPKGKAAHNRAQQRYRAKNKLSHQAYQKSPKGRAVNKKAVAKYARTAKGLAARQRATINSIIKKSREEVNLCYTCTHPQTQKSTCHPIAHGFPCVYDSNTQCHFLPGSSPKEVLDKYTYTKYTI